MKIQLNDVQMNAIKKAGINLEKSIAESLFNNSPNELSVNDLTIVVEMANATYRSGFPVISDDLYDSVYLYNLKIKKPDSEFLLNVEPEPVLETKTVKLPVKMLSTEKAYSYKEVVKWVDKLVKSAKEIELDLSNLNIRVTPKLDGYAAYDDGKKLYTRGNGIRGQDITRAFDRGLKVASKGERGLGAGEIVIKKSYFDDNLKDDFENSRNVLASVIAEKNVNKKIINSIKEEACIFFPFSLLYNWEGHYENFLNNFENILNDVWNSVDYEVDGIIAETINTALKNHMGSTRKHHRWQIAYKVNADIARVRILKVVPQTSRSGKLTPVAILNPTKLSGATINRATLHNYGMVKSKGVGEGALVELVRSGLVIPKIESVIEGVEPDIPNECPSCQTHVVWDGDNLFCPNTINCAAQAENTLEHFFKTLGNIDGFGPKVISKIYQSGVKTIYGFYNLDVGYLVSAGFGKKTADNLVQQLNASRAIEIEDWRFLAAFGIPRLGMGNCEKLLEHHRLKDIFELSVEDMIEIDGFAKVSASTIYEGLTSIKNEFLKVYELGFNIIETKKLKNSSNLSLEGEQIVFTGTMESGARSTMEANAKKHGAKVSKSVTGKTTFLVVGSNVGENKLKNAKEKGVKILTEAEYIAYLKKEGIRIKW